jgi:hypothetical protein
LTLACGKGTAITLKIEDLTDKKILDRIAALVEMGFRE